MLAHPRWVLGFLDEVWWSRLAQPNQHRWVDEDDRTRLQELERSKEDPDAKALACYGVLLRQHQKAGDQMFLRFVDGRRVSAVTIDFLKVCCQELEAQAVPVLVLIWDSARLSEESDSSSLDAQPQSEREANGQGRAHPALLVALEKPLASPD